MPTEINGESKKALEKKNEIQSMRFMAMTDWPIKETNGRTVRFNAKTNGQTGIQVESQNGAFITARKTFE